MPLMSVTCEVSKLERSSLRRLLQPQNASPAMRRTLPGTETAFQMVDTICEVGGARLGTQALTLLYEDEDTCAEAGLDWSLLPEPEPAKPATDFSKYHFNH